MQSVNYEVPFFQNPDNTHCFQACLKMVTKFFMPEQDFTWDELDVMTAKQPDMWTWSMSGLLWLSQNGYEVMNVEDFDYTRFSEEGADYLHKKWGQELTAAAIEHSIIDRETLVAKEFAQEVTTECRLPDLDEITKALADKNLVIINLNSAALNDKPGYIGHFIVVKGSNEHGLIVHDPGGSLPGIPSRAVSWDHFTKAWEYPDQTMKNMMVIGLASS